MQKPNKKILLSIVAVFLVLMTTIGFTYAWIDDIKLVEFQNDNLVKNGAPLKTGVDINSDVSITKSNSIIKLGNVLDQSTDLTYLYRPTDPQTGEQLSERPHTKYEGADSGKEPNWNDINDKKGYFYESGGMHLSPCYSDGESFYFLRQGDSGYREGNKDDENVNYISFTAKVSSPDANVDFWFESLPSIQGLDENGTAVDVSANARYSLTVDGECHVYSPSGEAQTCNANMTDTTDVIGTRKTSVYTYDNTDNKTEARGQNSNTLFSIKRGNTVYLTVKIWLEDGDDLSSVVTSNINLNLVSSWAYKRDITIVDYTSSCKYISSSQSSTTSSWLGNGPMYLVIPSVLEEMCKELYTSPTVDRWKDIRNNDGYGDAPFYNLRDTNITTNGTTDGFPSFTVKNVPLVYNNEQMIIYRCPSWNNTSSDHPAEDTSYHVKCYNWWSTYLPNTYSTGIYRLYGGSHDNYAKRYFPSTVDNKCETFQGYGTWGNLIKIQVDGKTKARRWSNAIAQDGGDESDLAEKFSNSDSIDLYVCDYSDKNTTGEVYIHGMSYEQSEGCWFAYVPESSTLLQFYYDNNNYSNTHKKGWWAYYSWSGFNPQQRPNNSTKYYFTHRVIHGNTDNPEYDGIGYWEGVDKVYLLKNGNISGADSAGAYMYHNDGKATSEDYDKSEPNMSDTEEKDPRDNETPIYEVSTVKNSNSGYFPYIKFKGIWNNGNPSYGAQVPMCPGCYFDWDDNIWYGSLTGSGRSAAVDDGSGGGGDSGGQESGGGENTGTSTAITNSEPTTEGLYAYGKLEKDGSYVQYAQFSSDSTGGNIVIYLEQGQDYQFMLRKGKKDNWTRYATRESNSGPTLSSTGTPAEWSLSNNNSQKIKLTVLNTGYYTISIKSSDSGSYNLQFIYN